MKRREFISLLGGAAASPCTWPFAAFGQASDKRPRRIGYISASSPAAAAQNLVAFLEGMRAHGYVEGRDIEIDYRWGEGTKIGLVANPDNIHSLIQRRELETAAATKDIKIVSIEARPQDVDSIFPTLSRERVDAVIVARDAMFYGERGRIAA